MCSKSHFKIVPLKKQHQNLSVHNNYQRRNFANFSHFSEQSRECPNELQISKQPKAWKSIANHEPESSNELKSITTNCYFLDSRHQLRVTRRTTSEGFKRESTVRSATKSRRIERRRDASIGSDWSISGRERTTWNNVESSTRVSGYAGCRNSKRPQALLNQYLVSAACNRTPATDTRRRYRAANKVTRTPTTDDPH